ncbi:esterase/lipase superfamily domain-containing protein [Histoplasma ohiense]|nr:esterase/lipase superfamily domain-containing protein [Histoplasma ohiense (nom. inval.)]
MSALQRSILRGRTQLMPARTVELLEKTVREQIERDGRGFVGVIGFSMGGRLAAGLLLEQQERLLAQQRANGGNASGNGFADCHLAPAPTGPSGGGGGEGQSFKFGVFICATSPPITKLHDLLDHDSTDGRGDKITLPQIDIPTLHILGLNDPWIAPGELLATTHFNQVKTTVRKLDMGHHLPTQQKDNMLLVEGILDMAKEIGI